MTTIQQQIDFVQHIRDSYDNEQRERIVVKYPAHKVAELLRDVQENLIAIKHVQLKKEVDLCSQCNQPGKPYELLDDVLCDRCAQIRLNNELDSINSTAGIP